MLENFLGDGIFTSDGDAWRRVCSICHVHPPTIDAYPLTDFAAYFGRHSIALLLALFLPISVLPTMIYLSDILPSSWRS